MRPDGKSAIWPAGKEDEARIKKHYSWQHSCSTARAGMEQTEQTRLRARLGGLGKPNIRIPTRQSAVLGRALSQQGNVELGRRNRLKVNCESPINMPRRVRQCGEERKL